MTLVTRSRPFWTPSIQTAMPMMTAAAMKIVCQTGSPSIFPNSALTDSVSKPSNLPVAVLTK